jgi:hypothetical protein
MKMTRVEQLNCPIFLPFWTKNSPQQGARKNQQVLISHPGFYDWIILELSPTIKIDHK